MLHGDPSIITSDSEWGSTVQEVSSEPEVSRSYSVNGQLSPRRFQYRVRMMNTVQYQAQ